MKARRFGKIGLVAGRAAAAGAAWAMWDRAATAGALRYGIRAARQGNLAAIVGEGA